MVYPDTWKWAGYRIPSSHILFIFTSEWWLHNSWLAQRQTISFHSFLVISVTFPEFRNFTITMIISEGLSHRLLLKSLYKSQTSQIPFDDPLIVKHVYIPILKSQSKDLHTKFFVNMSNSWGLFCWCLANQCSVCESRKSLNVTIL